MPSTAVARRDSAAGSLLAVPVRHPKAGAVLLLWLLGLWLAFMAKPARITEQQTVAFKEKLSEVGLSCSRAAKRMWGPLPLAAADAADAACQLRPLVMPHFVRLAFHFCYCSRPRACWRPSQLRSGA